MVYTVSNGKLEPPSPFPKPLETEDRIYPTPCRHVLKEGAGAWGSTAFFFLLLLLFVETMGSQRHALLDHGQKLILTEGLKLKLFKIYIVSAFETMARKTDCI